MEATAEVAVNHDTLNELLGRTLVDIGAAVQAPLTFTGILAYQDSKVESRQDYNGTAQDVGAGVVPDGFCAFAPAASQRSAMPTGSRVSSVKPLLIFVKCRLKRRYEVRCTIGRTIVND